jgi:hypothetical protein
MFCTMTDNTLGIGSDFAAAVAGPYRYTGTVTIAKAGECKTMPFRSAMATGDLTQLAIEHAAKREGARVVSFTWQSL